MRLNRYLPLVTPLVVALFAGLMIVLPERVLTQGANLMFGSFNNLPKPVSVSTEGYLNVSAQGAVTATVPGIATTSTDGLVLQNTTLSTSGATIQQAPRISWVGHVWNTAADELATWYAESNLTSAASPTAAWKLNYSRNGGATTTTLQVSSGGELAPGTDLRLVSAAQIYWVSKASVKSPYDGALSVTTNNASVGSVFKADALPTAGTCGTSPAVTAGSTPLAGSVNVGTGGTATSCTVNFNGTAFTTAPFCMATSATSNVVTRATATGTVLTLAATTAWTASDVVAWICIGPK